jgi:hypothetical protein
LGVAENAARTPFWMIGFVSAVMVADVLLVGRPSELLISPS